MNVYLENEKKLIEIKMKEIVRETQSLNRGDFVLAADGNNVTREKSESYKALMRMQEILNNNFSNLKSRFEYYELYEIAGFPRMDDGYYKLLTDSKKPINDEYMNVQRRIDELEAKAKTREKYVAITTSPSTQAIICLEDKEEYETLITMRNMLDNKFSSMNRTFDYMDLRVRTSLGQMSDFEYYALIGKQPNGVYKDITNTPAPKIEPKKDVITENVKEELLVEEVVGEEKKRIDEYFKDSHIDVSDVDFREVDKQNPELTSSKSIDLPSHPEPKPPVPTENLPIGLPPHIDPKLPISSKVGIKSNPVSSIEHSSRKNEELFDELLVEEVVGEEKKRIDEYFKDSNIDVIDVDFREVDEPNPELNTPKPIELPSHPEPENHVKPEVVPIGLPPHIEPKLPVPPKDVVKPNPVPPIELPPHIDPKPEDVKPTPERKRAPRKPAKPAKGAKIKVVAKKAWKWIKEHKKQILIGLGLASLAVATVVGISYLLPAIEAAMQASQISTLSTAMLNNGALWHGAIASEQVALHGANTALASMIEAISGSAAVFDTASGIWTIGGMELGKFAGAAAANAAATSSAVAGLSNAAAGFGLGGLGLTGLGLLGNSKSLEYREISAMIKNLKKKMDELDPNVVEKYLNEIIRKINTSPKLSNSEKRRLLKKVDALARKLDKDTYYENEEEYEVENPKVKVAM